MGLSLVFEAFSALEDVDGNALGSAGGFAGSADIEGAALLVGFDRGLVVCGDAVGSQ
jgi:hypothetical protein